ncbi:MAG: CPBP family intramembrane metalloprotease [Chlamydiota bacterium]|jgi:membrane protease YdiL (CAAX protease family)
MLDTEFFSEYLFFGFTIASIISLWLPVYRYTWIISYFFAFCFGLLSDHIKLTSLLPIAILAIASFKARQDEKKVSIYDLLILLIGVGMTLHVFKGFNNWIMIEKYSISDDALPFTMRFAFDKATLGIFLLAFIISLNKDFFGLKKIVLNVLLFTSILCLILFPISTHFHFAKFDPKFPAISLQWILNNLFIVSVSEEVFFRGFLQAKLSTVFNFRFGSFFALIVASTVFGLCHYSGGGLYIVLASFSGMIYGLSFLVSQRIEAAILTHFSLNAVHFFLFTYPALA